MKKILIVDDDPAIRRMLRIVLEEQYEVFEAVDCDSGFSAVMSIRPDLIILDVDLPDGTGDSLFDRIAEAGIDSQVIMLTACEDVELAQRVMGKGASGYVTKPFEVARLLGLIADKLTAPVSEGRPWKVESENGEKAQDKE